MSFRFNRSPRWCGVSWIVCFGFGSGWEKKSRLHTISSATFILQCQHFTFILCQCQQCLWVTHCLRLWLVAEALLQTGTPDRPVLGHTWWQRQAKHAGPWAPRQHTWTPAVTGPGGPVLGPTVSLLRCQWLWKTARSFLQKTKLELSYNSSIPLLGIYPKQRKSVYQRDSSTPMFTATLFTIAKI